MAKVAPAVLIFALERARRGRSNARMRNFSPRRAARRRPLVAIAALALTGCLEGGQDTPPVEIEPDAGCPVDAPADPCGVCGGSGPYIWYADVDGDGAGDYAVPVVACLRPDGFVDDGGDPEPQCATDDTDVCGECGGDGPQTFFADVDADGEGDDAITVEACAAPEGFVDRGGDPEPLCATDDTDACGVCGGPGPQVWYADADGDGAGDDSVAVEACVAPAGFVAEGGDPEPACATDDTDDCGICGGGDGDKDCVGVCFGQAAVDGCGRCVGGTTGREAAADDTDRDGIPDLCDQCPPEAVARTIIQWTRVAQADGSGGPYTFQVELFENGDFAFRYGSLEPWGATPTVGHQQLSGEQALALDAGGQLARDAGGFYFRRDADGRAALDQSVPPVFIDIQHSGEPLTGEFDERDALPVEFGFEFPFGEEVYAGGTVYADGTLVFAGPDPGGANSPLPRADLGAMLAPFWDDFDLDRQGTLQVQYIAAGCEADCAGMVGGVALFDGCGVCVGGTTNRVPDATRDCNGDCGGEAFVDACGQCAGGLSGNEPQGADDCPQAPDLIVDRQYMAETAVIDYLDVNDPCLIEERCVGGVGRRKILRFGTRIANIGNVDLRLGRPEEGNPLWDWDQCHGHYHFDAYAIYDLIDVETGERLPIGAKAGFSVIDIGVYDPEIAVDGCRGYNGRNQGITAGCQDTYGRNLQCQWIDVTDIADGTYDLVVTTNPERRFAELNHDNNAASVRVRLSGDAVAVLDTERLCADGVDDDGDGAIDCDDPDCDELCELPPRAPANICPADDLGSALGEAVAAGLEQPVEDGLAGLCAGGGRGEVALTWTAPADDTYVFHTRDSSFDTAVYVLDGGCDGAELACAEGHDALPGDDALVEVPLAEGQAVTVAVDGMLRDGEAEDGGRWRLSINGRRTGCPDQGDLASAVGPGVARGDTAAAATRRVASCAAGAGAHDTYAWTAPEAGTYTFDTAGSPYDTALFLLAADCDEELACNDDRDGLQSYIERDFEAGEAVVIGVGGYRGARGGYVLNIGRLVEADDCPAADLGDGLGGRLASVLAEDLNGGIESSCVDPETPDIGFEWVAPADDRYFFHTFGSLAETAIAVREGACDGAELACAADYGGTRGDTPVSNQAGLELDLAAGAAVTVVVEASGEGEAHVGIAGRTAACPEVELDGAEGGPLGEVARGTTVGAPTRMMASCLPSAAQVTLGWTAPVAGTYVFHTDGSSYDTSLMVLDGDCGEELACDDDGGEGTLSRATAELAAGQRVTVVVGGFRGRSGDYVLHIEAVDEAP